MTYYENHREEMLARQTAWNRAHPEKLKEYLERHKAKRRAERAAARAAREPAAIAAREAARQRALAAAREKRAKAKAARMAAKAAARAAEVAAREAARAQKKEKQKPRGLVECLNRCPRSLEQQTGSHQQSPILLSPIAVMSPVLTSKSALSPSHWTVTFP